MREKMAKFQYFFPVIVVIESILAGIILMFFRKYGSALYWIGVGLLNFTVIFLIKRWG